MAVPETTPEDQQPDETAPPPGPALVMLPNTGSFTSTATPVQVPEFKQEFANQAEAGKKLQAAGEGVVAPLVETKKAEIAGKDLIKAEELRQAGESSDFAAAQNLRHADVEREHSKAVAKAQDFYDGLEREAAGAKYHDWWDSKSTGDRVKAHIAMALGAFGSSLTHAPNFALEQINGEIARDERTQKDAIDRKFELAKRAAENLKGTKEDRERALMDIDKQRQFAEAALLHRQGKQLEAVRDEALKQQLAAGIPLEVAKQHEIAAKADLGAASARAGLAQKLNQTVTRQVSEATHAAQPTQAQTPKVLTDTLTGRDLPIDPNRTDARKHNAAAAQLPNVNGAIKILDSVLDKTKGGPVAPEATKYLPFGLGKAGETAADVNAEMTRFRSAYAAAKKESVGEANAKELASAIPDPPSSVSSHAAWEAWRKKIETTREEMYDMRKAHLANAGVLPKDIARETKVAPVQEAPKARKLSATELAGGSFVP